MFNVMNVTQSLNNSMSVKKYLFRIEPFPMRSSNSLDFFNFSRILSISTIAKTCLSTMAAFMISRQFLSTVVKRLKLTRCCDITYASHAIQTNIHLDLRMNLEKLTLPSLLWHLCHDIWRSKNRLKI